MTLHTGQLLQNRYNIVKLLARGGMGAVYLAQDMRLGGRYCAIKEQMADPKATPEALSQLREQFKIEASLLARLEHANLPNVFDYFSLSRNEYLVMDYIEGQNLEDVLKQEGAPLAESLVLMWADQVLSALTYLHTHQPHAIIHRDIKPANIILMASGHLKLVDFGLVKLFDPHKPATVTIVRGMGTPEYTPLEQYGTSTSHTDHRSDIYALGATLYHLLTNVAPPDAQHQFVDPAALVPLRQHNPALSARTEAAILKAMAMRPEQRFQSTQEFRAALFGTQPVVAAINPRISQPAPTIRVTSQATAQRQKKGGIPLVGWLAGIAVLLLLLISALLPRVLNNFSAADNPPTSVAEESATEEAANLPLATQTRASEAEPTASCIFQSDFVKDVTIPDGTLMEGGERFIKTWRMRNSGTCDWPADRHRIVFAGGEQLGPASIGMPATKVGEEVDISLEMQAPPEAGSYEGTWELWDQKGEPYGFMTVLINVPGEATSTPAPSTQNQSESKLAFASERDGNSEIYIQSNGLVERLTNHSSGDWKPTWSPDGSQIAFESDRTDNYDIYRMNANRSNQINLTDHPDNDSWPAWSSTGRIAFQSNREKNWEIYQMNPDGSNLINLTNTRTHELQPAWSPDGRQIAFISTDSTDNERWDIYVMNADGTNRRQLTTHEADDMHPAWSPDGSQIAFTSYRDGNFELYLMKADGSSKKRLTLNPEANDIQPVWHPDGAQLSFTSNLNGSDNELYLINSDGSGLSNLTKSFGDDRWPAWWP